MAAIPKIKSQERGGVKVILVFIIVLFFFDKFIKKKSINIKFECEVSVKLSTAR
jgi:hypothetical protein